MDLPSRTVVRVRPPAPTDTEQQLPMPEPVEQYAGIEVSDRCLWRDGSPWFPVTGEVHYSRLPRHRWTEALRLTRAGGVTVVATYVFWIHHQPQEDAPPRFDEHLDVAEFVRTAADVGLDVVLRIGPWCHGEVRNGGHPDWVVDRENHTERSDDPVYLRRVRTWFGQLAGQLAPWCGPQGPVVGIQLENELCDQREHIRTLKRLAREAGLHAPLWTATAWGPADIPVGDVFPMYGGYSDGFWVETHQGWQDDFRQQFEFSDEWDEPVIGVDLAGPSRSEAPVPARALCFPPATCELGGGMASAYHRRVAVGGRDVSTVAHCKLGSGSIWQGYYMYVGGTNPAPDLQESHASGYPNDLPEFNYDFGAAIGAHLQVREHFHRLRNQHSFLAAHGERFVRMTSTIPAAAPETAGHGDVRWALRSDDLGGYLFLNTHRPHEPFPASPGVAFQVALGGTTLHVPHEPVDVPAGEAMAWPLLHEVGGVTLRWATATVLTTIQADDGVPVLVLVATDGVPVHLAVPSHHRIGAAGVVVSGDDRVLPDVLPGRSFVEIEGPRGRARVLVLTAQDALRAWTCTVEGARRLVLSDAEAVLEEAGGLTAVVSAPVTAHVFPAYGTTGPDGFSRHPLCCDLPDPHVEVELLVQARPPAEPRLGLPDKASAPLPAEVERCSARYRITVSGHARAGERSLLRLDIVGDVARSTFGARVEDVFWNGTEWDVDITPDEDVDERVVEVLVYPLTPRTPVLFPDDAARLRRPGADLEARVASAEVVTFQTVPLLPTVARQQ